MKKEMKILFGWSKIRKSSALFAPLIAAMIGWAPQPAQAAVQVTQFDPPLKISVWGQVSTNDYFKLLPTDFNADGAVDFRLAYGIGAVEAYFDAPTRFAKRVPPFVSEVPPLNIAVPITGGPVAAVPLNSRIGTSIVSPGTNIFAWSIGDTNTYDLTQPIGDHEATVITANLAIPLQPIPVISFSANGTAVTNSVVPAPTFGDVVNREGVMAVEFYINGEPHYGYIHFDFRNGIGGNFGGGGVIYGWAYETEPNVTIKAKPLSTSRTRVHLPPPTEIRPAGKPPITAQPQ